MALQLVTGSKVAGFVAQQGIKKAGKTSIELFGYNFVNLVMMLSVYYLLAFIIAKYFEAVIFGKGAVNELLKLVGVLPVFPENEIITKLFSTGFGDQKIVYWDLIKGISVILVVTEWYRFNEMQKSIGGETSYVTHGVFSLIVGLLTIITIPKLLTSIKALNIVGGITK